VGRPLRVLHLGRLGYAEVESLQERVRAQVLSGDARAETLLLVEHPPVVTLGRRAGEAALRVSEQVLEARGIALHRSSRGGEATYHGPGQLVAYPILRLDRGVAAHVEALAHSAVAVAASIGVAASYGRACPGVWVGERKLASIGVHVHRRVAMHGLALNLTIEALAGFASIVPCGNACVEMTSLQSEGAVALPLREAAERYAIAFAAASGRTLETHVDSTFLAAQA
jgi:lipoate-protein ligase B